MLGRYQMEPGGIVVNSIGSSDRDLGMYLRSPDYERHAAAARQVWGDPDTMKTAGVAVFLAYLSVPTLNAVRSGRGRPARSILEGNRERAFLMRLLGLDLSNGGCSEGIKDAGTRRQCEALRRQHMAFSGMTLEYLSFMAIIIASAPLCVAEVYSTPHGAALQDEYWEYMRTAMALVGGHLGQRDDDLRRVDDYLARHCGLTPMTARSILALRARHPVHFARCLPTLNHSARRVAVEAIGRYRRCP
jgi:hypothetical protein